MILRVHSESDYLCAVVKHENLALVARPDISRAGFALATNSQSGCRSRAIIAGCRQPDLAEVVGNIPPEENEIRNYFLSLFLYAGVSITRDSDSAQGTDASCNEERTNNVRDRAP